ncbi:phage tail protein [Lentzea sp. BCCO 10_0061]|uniref:Phage tail protein n=1 Tax=Lentzea sokolovensis TaxID=3095429 RepID=A0ABU4V6F6_9PSEU|nr:phage tail protein [Lentzea sp. BCCO 10_0061]MDX8147385.1 phage tail protein [Lentzea sp. BCCO 10_0061]
MTSPASSYFAHLPRIYHGNADLDALLKVFEKILSGRADDVEYRRPGLAESIDLLPTLFDPASVRADFLPWLAGVVGLELQSTWDERLRRRAIRDIVTIYGQRGSQAGLARYLDLYSADVARQRITIDGAAKVLFARLRGSEPAPVHALVTQGPCLLAPTNELYPGLTSVACLGVTPDGHLVVGDSGAPGPTEASTQPAGVWRMTLTGEFADLAGAPPRPRPLGAGKWRQPVALAFDTSAAQWVLYVIDLRAGAFQLIRVTAGQPFTETVVAMPAGATLNLPNAMVFDAGHLLILDVTDVVDVDLATNTWKRRALTGAMTPLGMVRTAGGDIIVTDAREQDGTATPGDLLKVNRANPSSWTAVRLLAGLPSDRNPLVAPVAVVEDRDGSLLVADTGLKPLRSGAGPFLRTVVEPSAVYRVRLGSAPSVERVSTQGQLVFPTGMALRDRTLYFGERGDPNDPAMGSEVAVRRNFRAASHEFAVTVHFDADNTSSDEQRAVHAGISEIVDRQRPAAAWYWLMSAVGT